MDRPVLEKAVALGIISADQMNRILALAGEPGHEAVSGYGDDERFRLISGFNDIFLALGVGLFGAGVYGVSVAFGGLLIGSVIGAVSMWVISELFAARLRMTLPSMTAATGLCIFVVLAFFVQIMSCGFGAKDGPVCPDLGEGPVLPVLIVSGSGAVAAVLYYWRFRLPFSLFLLAIILYFMVLVLVMRGLDWSGLAPGDLGWIIQWTSLVFGALVFAAAMAFDLSDRHRVTRRSDAAFWLHLAAAPLIVHSIMFNLAYSGGGNLVFGYAGVMVVFLLRMYVSLVVDRRAILVATLTYVGTVVAYVINRFGSAEASVFFTLIALGLSVIVLGVGWRPLRRSALKTLPSALVARLPVVRDGQDA